MESIMSIEQAVNLGGYLSGLSQKIFCEEFDIEFKKVAQHIHQTKKDNGIHFLLCVNGNQKFLLKYQNIHHELHLQHFSLDMRPLIPFFQNKLFSALGMDRDNFEDLSNPRLQNNHLDFSINPGVGGWHKEELGTTLRSRLAVALLRCEKPFMVAPLYKENPAQIKKNSRNVVRHSLFAQAAQVGNAAPELPVLKKTRRKSD
jgi:hypothetical protein